MAFGIGIFLGIIFGFAFRLHRQSSQKALIWSFATPIFIFILISILYFNFKKDPFDVILGINRYPTDWANRGVEAKAWGPTEANWGPEEEHLSTAIGLSFSRYMLGYFSLGISMFGVYLVSSVKTEEEVENRDENGVIRESGSLKFGLKHGKWQFFDANGEVYKEEIWFEGELSERNILKE